MDFDPERDYPLGTKRPDLVSTPSGIQLAEVTVEAVRGGLISADDMRATAETLEIYTALRPHRSTAAELGEWADRLESSYEAELTAAFVRQAGSVYSARGLLAPEG